MTDLLIARLDGRSAREILDALVAVYADVYSVPPYAGDPFFAVGWFAERLGLACDMPGFELVVALDGTEVAGYAFGVALPPDRPWWVHVQEALTPDQRRDALSGKVFWVRELMVRQPYRGIGVGRLLHEALLARRPERWAALTCLPDNEPAHGAYLRWHYRSLGETSHGPGSPTYDAMMLAIRQARHDRVRGRRRAAAAVRRTALVPCSGPAVTRRAGSVPAR